MILPEIFRLVSGFPRYSSCYIAESRLPLGQIVCTVQCTVPLHCPKKSESLNNWLNKMQQYMPRFVSKQVL